MTQSSPPPAAPVPPVTGYPDLDAALAVLSDLPHRPLAEHVTAYESVHHTLRHTLEGIDQS